MATKKRTAKKKPTRKVSGLVAYRRKLNSNKTVKSKTKKVKDLEKKLAAAKREKAAAIKKVRKTIKK